MIFPSGASCDTQSVTSYNNRWLTSANFLKAANLIFPKYHVFIISPFATYLFDLECAGIKDYISTVKTRLADLDRFISTPAFTTTVAASQRRANLYNLGLMRGKAPPSHAGLLNADLKPWVKDLVIFWFFTASRVSSLLSSTPFNFPPCSPSDCPPLLKCVTAPFSKVAPDPPRQLDLRWIPTSLVPRVRNLFPVQRSTILTEILAPLSKDGISTHSFRRGLAVAVRRKLFDLGLRTKKSIVNILPKLNTFFGWSQSSQEFFSYPDDFRSFDSYLYPQEINPILEAIESLVRTL